MVSQLLSCGSFVLPCFEVQGLAKVVEWSANMLEPAAKAQLKAAELEAKRQRLRLWANFVVPPSASTALKDDSFTGHVVEVVSGDCLIVAEDAPAAPGGTGGGGEWGPERRVNLSSIRARKMGNPRRDEKPEAYAREAKEFLRQRLIGQQVSLHPTPCTRQLSCDTLVPIRILMPMPTYQPAYGSVLGGSILGCNSPECYIMRLHSHHDTPYMLSHHGTADLSI